MNISFLIIVGINMIVPVGLYLVFVTIAKVKMMSNNVFEEVGIKLPTLKQVDEMTEPLTAVALLTNPEGWRWFVVAGDVTGEGDVYCYGKVEGIFDEWGFFLLSDVLSNGGLFDLSFSETSIV